MVYSTKTTAIIEHIIYDEMDDHYGAEPEYPWNDWKAVLRRNDNNKWYGVVLKVSADKLGASEAAGIDLRAAVRGKTKGFSRRQVKWKTIDLNYSLVLDK